MIASLRGPVLALTAQTAVIECGGVGLAVTLTPAAREGLRLGAEGAVATQLVVRQDALTLYGFADVAERDTFVVAQSASGVGPKLALALVATLGADGLASAVAQEDVAALIRVPGLGRKGALKLILALAGKLVSGDGAGGAEAAHSDVEVQVRDALQSLGWPAGAAAEAVQNISAAPDAPRDVTGLLRLALRELGGGR
jgi:Holliday junction DNA helicase RuvA